MLNGLVANFIGFQQCKVFENRLRFDKTTDSLQVGTFFETQCSYDALLDSRFRNDQVIMCRVGS